MKFMWLLLLAACVGQLYGTGTIVFSPAGLTMIKTLAEQVAKVMADRIQRNREQNQPMPTLADWDEVSMTAITHYRTQSWIRRNKPIKKVVGKANEIEKLEAYKNNVRQTAGRMFLEKGGNAEDLLFESWKCTVEEAGVVAKQWVKLDKRCENIDKLRAKNKALKEELAAESLENGPEKRTQKKLK